MTKSFKQINLIDNSPMGLVDALAERLDKILGSSWWHESEKGDSFHHPYIHKQYLPVSIATEERVAERDLPIIRIFHSSGKMDNMEDATITIILAAACYDDDNNAQGWRLPMALLWAVLQDLLANSFVSSFEMTNPIEWMPSDADDGNPPYWNASLVTTWKVRNIIKEVGNLDNHNYYEETIDFQINSQS